MTSDDAVLIMKAAAQVVRADAYIELAQILADFIEDPEAKE